jgi:hypothetical protein
MLATASLAKYGYILLFQDTRFQQQFLFNVWEGISGDLLLASYELPRPLSGVSCLQVLSERIQLMDDARLTTRQALSLMHHGAPAYLSGDVMRC